MKYRLSDEDYLRLWPVAMPHEIEEEFGADRSFCARHIYRLYRKYRLSQIKRSRKEMREKILADSPTNATAVWINQEIDKLIEEGRDAHDIKQGFRRWRFTDNHYVYVTPKSLKVNPNKIRELYDVGGT